MSGSMERIKLNVLGISYSQTQTGAYALILTEEKGNRRIPIIVGTFEAQAIAIQLEGLKPPRPLTHDLFLAFAKASEATLVEVDIYKLEEGVFHSNLLFNDGKKRFHIDGRTSDAIALALRFNCPIYTNENIMAKAGMLLEFEKTTKSKKTTETSKPKSNIKGSTKTESLQKHNLKELEEMLDDSILNEDYERASELRDEIRKRTNK